MLTVAGRRGRRVGGELSWGGLEGGEREATRALSLAALGSEAARAAARAACSATAALRVQLAYVYIQYVYIFNMYIYSLWASACCRSGRLLSLFLAREDAGLCLLLRACTQSAPAHRGAAGMITRLARRPPATSASEAECQ